MANRASMLLALERVCMAATPRLMRVVLSSRPKPVSDAGLFHKVPTGTCPGRGNRDRAAQRRAGEVLRRPGAEDPAWVDRTVREDERWFRESVGPPLQVDPPEVSGADVAVEPDVGIGRRDQPTGGPPNVLEHRSTCHKGKVKQHLATHGHVGCR